MARERLPPWWEWKDNTDREARLGLNTPNEQVRLCLEGKCEHKGETGRRWRKDRKRETARERFIRKLKAAKRRGLKEFRLDEQIRKLITPDEYKRPWTWKDPEEGTKWEEVYKIRFHAGALPKDAIVAKARLTRAEHRRQGKCSECWREALDGYKLCWRCRMRHREVYRRKKAKEDG